MKKNDLITPLTELETARPVWSKPALLDYGKVAELTQGGYYYLGTEDSLYNSIE